MNVLITGARGLLGQKLIERLKDNTAYHLLATAKEEENSAVKIHALDITSSENVEHIFTTHKPDVVLHTAAMTNVDDCERNHEACYKANVEAVSHIVHACENYHAKLIHLSTDFIFDGTKERLQEDETPNPVNYYGQCKWEAEKIVQQSSASWCILRTVLVYGYSPRLTKNNLVLWVKKSLEQQKEIQVVNDQFRTPTLAEDLAQACELSMKKKAVGIYHISGEELMTPYDMALKTAANWQLDATLIKQTDGTKFVQAARRPPKTGFNITKAKKELGFQPTSFEDGLRLMATQMKG